MDKDFYLKCFNNQIIKEVKLHVSRDKDNAIIDFAMENLYFSKTAEYYFAALVEVRKELEARGIKLLCKGCCRNVYPSNMSIEMGGGVLAYTMTMGKECERSDLVNIFDACELEEYGTIEEQLRFCDEWYEDIKRVRASEDE